MSLTDKNVCEKCSVRVPKNRPVPVCYFCNIPKHYRCQNLSRTDAEAIVHNAAYQWICGACIADILPVNAYVRKCNRDKNENIAKRFKEKCMCCGGQSYSPKNIKVCMWCDQPCHIKCLNGDLGCIKCCELMIPGFHAHNYELCGNVSAKNDVIYNPYNQSHIINRIGEQISREEEDNSMWNEISDCLLNCKYIQPKDVKTSKPDELNVLSLNIRSLSKNIGVISDNIIEYQKYDVILLLGNMFKDSVLWRKVDGRGYTYSSVVANRAYADHFPVLA